ncbi:TRAM domain-containing protein [Brucepastera parasyntrophica]|uniref:class I SAM-dependent RNA methyltransferase n=1 Tax=Brucepastera parasyntrophica TaxID=2880008 RepID=UPI002108FB10|nr:TRAM domain-containing protein [Brucepastera parasyntrophica]ULQ60032.1 TRAM domain-containing protein [Brucepastera parasyntrophica]
MTIITEKMVSGGSCIARINGKVVFIPFSLPGETLEVEISEKYRDYDIAHITSILESSPKRVVPPCPLFGICGGCSLQMAENDYQLELKKLIVGDILARAGIHFNRDIKCVSGNPFEYRSRFQFSKTEAGKIGLKKSASNSVIPLADCPIAVTGIRQALAENLLSENQDNSPASGKIHVFAYSNALFYEGRDTSCAVTIDGRELRFDINGFFQSNIPMLEQLLRCIVPKSAGKPGVLLDFYAGVGTFSVFMAEKYTQTVLVEENTGALLWAEKNLMGKAENPVFCAVKDSQWPFHSEAKKTFSMAVIDPPRQGIHKKMMEWLKAVSIPEISYVSCNPVTFARDAAALLNAGYILQDIILFDFYPQTHHIELVGFFINEK